VWDNLFWGFWLDCLLDGGSLDGCLPNCPLNNIVEILDDKNPNFFAKWKKITFHQGFNHLNSPRVPHNGYKGATKNKKPT
jgi:hypothetical protein